MVAREELKHYPGIGLWHGKIRARGYKDGKRVVIGCFENLEDAVKAYQDFYEKHPKKTDEEISFGNTYRRITYEGKAGASGYRGVRLHSSGRWEARIQLRGQRYYLGCYELLQDAVNARKEAEEHLFGGFVEWYEAREKERGLAESVTKAEE